MAKLVHRTESCTTGKQKGLDLRLSLAEKTHAQRDIQLRETVKEVDKLKDYLQRFEKAASIVKLNGLMVEDQQKEEHIFEDSKVTLQSCLDGRDNDLDMGNKSTLTTKMNDEGFSEITPSDLKICIRSNQQMLDYQSGAGGGSVSVNKVTEVSSRLGLFSSAYITANVPAAHNQSLIPVSSNNDGVMMHTSHPEIFDSEGKNHIEEQLKEAMCNLESGVIPNDIRECSLNLRELAPVLPNDLKDIPTYDFGIQNKKYLEEQSMDCNENFTSIQNCLKYKNPNCRIPFDNQIPQPVHGYQQGTQMQTSSTRMTIEVNHDTEPLVNASHITDQTHISQDWLDLAVEQECGTQPDGIIEHNQSLIPVSSNNDGVMMHTSHPGIFDSEGKNHIEEQLKEAMCNLESGVIPNDIRECSLNLREQAPVLPDDLKGIPMFDFGIQDKKYLEEQPMDCNEDFTSIQNCLKYKNPNCRIPFDNQIPQPVHGYQQGTQMQTSSTRMTIEVNHDTEPLVNASHITDQTHISQDWLDLAVEQECGTQPDGIIERNTHLIQYRLPGSQSNMQQWALTTDLMGQDYTADVIEQHHATQSVSTLIYEHTQPVHTSGIQQAYATDVIGHQATQLYGQADTVDFWRSSYTTSRHTDEWTGFNQSPH